MEAFILAIPVGYLIVTVVGLVMEKKLRAKYNGAVGLLNSFLFTGGLFGGVAMLVMMLFGSMEAENPAEVVIASIVCVALAVVMLFLALRKCPMGSRSVPAVIVAMFLVGAAASMRIFGFLMKLVFHLDLFAGRDPGTGYSSYYKDSNGAECQLWTSNGSYAVLKGPDGTTFEVRPHGSDGLVSDNSNNIYYPM